MSIKKQMKILCLRVHARPGAELIKPTYDVVAGDNSSKA